MNNKIKEITAILIGVVTFVTAACSDEDLKMSDTFISSNSYAEYTDQIPIQLSTFKKDSVQTSGYNKVWVGRCSKPIIGNIYSESFLKMSQPNKYEWFQNERYDSITVILRHTGEYEGDTMQAITLNMYRLATPLEFTEKEKQLSVFYNPRTFRDSTLLGTYTFVPRPHSRPRVRMPLSHSFGKELFEFVKKNQNNPNKTEEFYRRFLGGIKIAADTASAHSLIAFRADSVQIVLHTHFPGFRLIEIERTLTLTESNLQFNHIWNDGITQPYDKLENIYNQVTEEDGGIHSVMFEGLGYYTRINFPTLSELKNQYYSSHIVRATLKIYLEQGSYDKRHFPSTFHLSKINRGNVVIGSAINSNGGQVSAILVNNLYDRDQVYYYLDLTYYLNSILSQDGLDDKEGLVITWGNSMDATNYNFMLFNGYNTTRRKCKSILEIYYYDYDEEDR